MKLGKTIEHNVIGSLRLANADIITSAELDHNYKIDCLLQFDKKQIGIQLSLQNNKKKSLNFKNLCP